MKAPYTSRSPVFGLNGMVATSQPLAVAAGLHILERGGNAADAAIATAAALSVTEPTSTGIGGDCFALFYDASTRRVTALNGSGRAPAALTLERLQREGFTSSLPRFCLKSGTPENRIALESGIPQSTLETLADWGHPARRVDGWERALFGRGQVILRHPKSGVLMGGSDLRADGCAMPLL